MHRVIASSPAKVNLALAVTGLEPSGYHQLDTIFEALDIYDDVEVTSADDLTLEVTGVDADKMPDDPEANLVLKAARLLAEATGTTAGAHISVTKRIPAAGGMAGGSTDAAATLVALNMLWETGLSAEQLVELGAKLGADVPFCLMGGLARGVGRGDVLNPLRPGTMHAWVLLTNPEGLSTPAAFAEFDRALNLTEGFERNSVSDVDDLAEALQGEDIDAIGALLTNDLEAALPGLRPDVTRTILGIRGKVPGVILSGSGPTIAVLTSMDDHGTVASGMRKDFPELGVLTAYGPARGAHIRTAE